MEQSTFHRSYNSFSGVDIKAVVGDTVLATLQAITFAITRERPQSLLWDTQGHGLSLVANVVLRVVWCFFSLIDTP